MESRSFYLGVGYREHKDNVNTIIVELYIKICNKKLGVEQNTVQYRNNGIEKLRDKLYILREDGDIVLY